MKKVKAEESWEVVATEDGPNSRLKFTAVFLGKRLHRITVFEDNTYDSIMIYPNEFDALFEFIEEAKAGLDVE